MCAGHTFEVQVERIGVKAVHVGARVDSRDVNIVFREDAKRAEQRARRVVDQHLCIGRPILSY